MFGPQGGVRSGEVRLGVAGLGRAFDRLYLPALRATPGMRLTAVFDPDTRRPGVPSAYRAQSFADLLTADIDGVVILSPPRFHGGQVAEALRAGLPVLVEKPPALTTAEMEAWPAIGAGVTPAFPRRYWPAYLHLRKTCGAGVEELGLITNPSDWGSVETPGEGPAQDLLPHLVDLCRWITREEVVSASAHGDGQVITATLELATGRRVRCVAGHGDSYEEWTIRGGRTMRIGPGSIGHALRRRLLGRPSPEALGMRRMLGLWVGADASDRRGFNDAWAAVSVVEACVESARSGGTPVRPREMAGC